MHLRQYEIVQDTDKLKVDIQATCMKYKTIKQWAYILHDKDDTRPHYHIYLNFGTSIDSKLVAEWFQLGYTDKNGKEQTGEQFIEKVKGRKADVLMYLTHENESQKYKHTYAREEVHSNFDVGTEIELGKIVGDFQHFSYAQQLEYIHGLPLNERLVSFKKLESAWKEHCQWLSLQSDRNLEVVFVYGKARSGKTYYAKKLFKQMDLDFCVSSSSNDPFQDYLGQKGMLLDDIRDNMFINSNGTDNLEDLLKILDNNTSSSVRSRFANKVFNGSVIIMTSTKPLKYWFPNRRTSGYDDLTQLYRRIGCYVEITPEIIKVYPDGLDEFGEPKGKPNVYKNELETLKKTETKKTDFCSVFDRMCEKPETIITGETHQVAMTEILDDELPF